MVSSFFKKIGFTVLGISILMISMTAYANTTLSSYDVIVPRLNGSGYSGNQIKANTGENGLLSSGTVGGSYTVDVRMQDTTKGINGPWIRNVNDSTRYILYSDNQHLAGDTMRAQFSNDLTTLVDVKVTGHWKSN